MSSPLKIAIVVQGRINAFDLARELIRQGHEITLVTNYPAFIVARWGLPSSVVVSLLPHGLVNRLAERLGLAGMLEPFLHKWFGRMAERALRGRRFDAVIVYSGVAEEMFRARRDADGLRVLLRASSHIEEQREILLAEEARAGLSVDKPSLWRVEREKREYELAGRLFILGGFSQRSFLSRGIPAEKLWVIHMTADLRVFRATEQGMAERRRRVLAGGRLQVLNTGTFSHRKGCLDMVDLARLIHSFADFIFLGTVVPEAAALAAAAEKEGLIRFLPRVPERELPAVYARGDVFVMPTLEDGFPAVVAHAKAAGLPVLVTGNCDTADIIEHGVSGWVLPVRSPEVFASHLKSLHDDRAALAAMSQAAWQGSASRGWDAVAAETVSLVRCDATEDFAGAAGAACDRKPC
jgi:glycosyltransferase involved in cell wall biosynthesis